MLRIGIAGLGTVGSGVVKILQEHSAELAERCGRKLEITGVSARDLKKHRGFELSARIHADPVALASAEDTDTIVELMGGSEDPAHSLVREALSRGKSVVTANKALLSRHGLELSTIAERTGAALFFEGAVAGGIPIIKSMREALAGNRIDKITGILNGTCNFILSEMTKSGRALAEVLKEAQALGYAEADPSFDIDGIDAAHKLSLLSALAFGIQPNLSAIKVEGIRQIAAADIAFADELGYRIKLLGSAQRAPAGIVQRVSPVMIDRDAAIARIDGPTNAVIVEGWPVGMLAFYGPGAGSGATASAVVADIVDIARGHRGPPFIVPAAQLAIGNAPPTGALESQFYVRLTVADKAGVLAAITAALARHDVSIESFLQHGRAPGGAVTVVLTTHLCAEGAMAAALADIVKIESVLAPPMLIRIEPLH